MASRWTQAEDKRIAQQLNKGIVIGAVMVPGRKKDDVRKRAYRIGLLVKQTPMIERRAAQWVTIKAALQTGDMTRKQLCTQPGMTDDIVRRVLEQHRDEVHVSGWVLESLKGKCRSKVWKLGAGEDAVEEGEAERIASRGDPEEAMVAEARKRLRETEERGELIRRDPFVAALFGQYRPSATRQTTG